jgi:hypothetical protein
MMGHVPVVPVRAAAAARRARVRCASVPLLTGAAERTCPNGADGRTGGPRAGVPDEELR